MVYHIGSIAFLILFLGFFQAYGAWTPPNSAPPGGNIAPPINTGSGEQTKSGNLIIEGDLRGGRKITNYGESLDIYGLPFGGFPGIIFYTYNTAGDTFIPRARFLSNSPPSAFDLLEGTVLRIYDTDDNERILMTGNELGIKYFDSAGVLDGRVRLNASGSQSSFISPSTAVNPVRFGIGNTNPATELDVTGQIHATGDICTDAGSGICLSTAGGGEQWILSGTNIYNANSGNVGIGTINPTAKLEVVGRIQAVGDVCTNLGGGGTGTCLSTVSGGGVANGTLAGQTLRWDGSIWLANGLLFNNGTNIGIGVSSPQTKLDIAGELRANGAFRMGNGVATSGVPFVPSPNFWIQSAFWNGTSSQSRVWSLRAETSSLTNSTVYLSNPAFADVMTIGQNGNLTVTGDVCTSTVCLNSVGGGGWTSDASGIHNTTGGVGIGGNSWTGIPLRLHTNTASSNLMSFERSGVTAQYNFLMDDAATGGNLSISAYNGIWIRALAITPAGRVGIGGFSPIGSALQIFGTSDEILHLERSSGERYRFDLGTDKALAIKNRVGDVRLKIDEFGNVYIPTLGAGIGCSGTSALATNTSGQIICDTDDNSGVGGGGTANAFARVEDYLDAVQFSAGPGEDAIEFTSGLGLITTFEPLRKRVNYSPDTLYLQRRVTPGCGAGEAIQSVAQSGTPTCIAVGGGGGGGGTVTSVGAGTGLAASPVNPFTVSGTLAIDQTWLNSWGDGRYLTPVAGNAAFVNVGGDTMTGALTISAGGLNVTGSASISSNLTLGGGLTANSVNVGGASAGNELHVQGDAKITGNASIAGIAGIGYEIVQATCPAGTNTCTAVCPTIPIQKRVVGGGCLFQDGDAEINKDHPSLDGSRWICTADNEPTGADIQAYAICANVGP
ncbi:MAG: hypothetical protein HYV77_01715 [Candidatus Wildermuthbacteria bacterium]|nr:hypothetical protein [Candidatus Wildermuthbacteria bacterium]